MPPKPLVPGPGGLFHFWPLPLGTTGPAPAASQPLSTPPEDDTIAGARVAAGPAGPLPHVVRAELRSSGEGLRGREPETGASESVADSNASRPAGVATQLDERVLITGITGGQGRLLYRRLMGRAEIIGVDRVPWDGHPLDLRMHVLDLRRRKLEDIFRIERPTAVVHLAFLRHFDADPRLRHAVNVAGTRQVLDYCVAYGVRRLVVLSSAYVYGALPENPGYMGEESPLNVSRTYPEIRDLAEVDTLCGVFLWRYPHIRTTILRPVNTLGQVVHSAVGRYLQLDYVPTILGFDPMWQFIHEADLAEAIALALEKGTHGSFNVTGSGAVPLSVAIRECGGTPVPIPEMLARLVMTSLFRFGLSPFPPGAIDFVKYPCTVDGRRFAEITGYAPQFVLRDTFASARR
jgi:UDP-glucose 4-epimerase